MCLILYLATDDPLPSIRHDPHAALSSKLAGQTRRPAALAGERHVYEVVGAATGCSCLLAGEGRKRKAHEPDREMDEFREIARRALGADSAPRLFSVWCDGALAKVLGSARIGERRPMAVGDLRRGLDIFDAEPATRRPMIVLTQEPAA